MMPEIRRYRLDDFDDWMLGRLLHQWEGHEQQWRYRITSFQGNEYMFVTNEDAVLLAVQQRHEMTGKPVVREILAWSRAADLRNGQYGIDQHSPHEIPMRALYQHLNEWGVQLGATRLYVGVCSDLTPGLIRALFSKQDAYYVVGVPC